MADRESEVLLRYKVDRASQAATVKSARDIRKSLDDIGRAKDIGRAASSMRDFKKETDSARQSVDRLATSQEQFESTSRRVALAGDVQSNLGAARGLAGIAGLGGLDRGVGAAGEIVVLAEELPRLKTALAGLPATIGAAAAALGPVGAGLAGVAVVAAGAFKLLSDAQQRVRESTERLVELETSRAENEASVELLILQGKRTEALQRLAAQEDETNLRIIQRQKLEEDLAAAQDRLAFERSKKKGGENEELAVDSDAMNQAKSDIKGFEDAIAALNMETGQATQTMFDTAAALGIVDKNAGLTVEGLDAITAATAELRDTSNEAADAGNNLTSTILRLASAEAQALAAAQQAAARDAEANRNRLKQIEDQTAVYERELDILRQSGDTSEAVTQRLAQLNSQLEQLGREAVEITQLLPGQESIERAKANKDAAEKTLDEEKALATERATIAENLRNDLEALALDTARKQADAFAKLQESITELQNDLARDLASAGEDARREAAQAQTEFQRQQVQADVEHYRTLEDLRRKFERDEQSAALDRDFRRLFELRQQRQREFEDAARARQEGLEDAQTEYDQQNADRAAALQQERQDIIAAAVIRRMELQADYQKQLEVIRTNQAQQLVELSNKYGFELNLMQGAHSQEAALLQNAINAELALRQSGYIAELGLLQQFVSSISLLSPRTLGSSTTPTPLTKSGGTGSTRPPVPSTPNKPADSKPPVTININGGNEDRVIKVVNKALSE